MSAQPRVEPDQMWVGKFPPHRLVRIVSVISVTRPVPRGRPDSTHVRVEYVGEVGPASRATMQLSFLRDNYRPKGE